MEGIFQTLKGSMGGINRQDLYSSTNLSNFYKFLTGFRPFKELKKVLGDLTVNLGCLDHVASGVKILINSGKACPEFDFSLLPVEKK